MSDSILNQTKKVLGLDESHKSFDVDVLMHINSVFSTLQQLGVGPARGFYVEDDRATWSSYVRGDLGLNSVKTYMYAKVRLLFDPPTTSFAITAMENQIKELEWRLNVHAEASRPVETEIPTITRVLDGGSTVMSDYTFKLRRGTDAEWAASDPVLQAGEPGYATNVGVYKIGDGYTKWSRLQPFLNREAMLNETQNHGGSTDEGPSFTLLYENAKV